MSSEEAGEGQGKAEEQAGNSPHTVNGPSIISYNLREGERPGGMKARYKIKIATGRKARELDERQAEVIRDQGATAMGTPVQEHPAQAVTGREPPE